MATPDHADNSVSAGQLLVPSAGSPTTGTIYIPVENRGGQFSVPLTWGTAWVVAKGLAKFLMWFLILAATIISTAIGWIIYIYTDIKTKINSQDDKIRAEVVSQVNEARKELTKDTKEAQGELELYQITVDAQRTMYEYSCRQQYN